MKFLVIAQDLRVSGTSEGVVSRSFLAKLRKAYPNAIIDVLYLKNHSSDDDLNLLPLDSIRFYDISLKAPFLIKWLNRISTRMFYVSSYDNYIHKLFSKHITNVDYKKYNHVFVRSSGLNHETILALKNLPILEKSILNFHDPYPLGWYVGYNKKVTSLDFFRLKQIMKVVSQAKTCSSAAHYMSHDLKSLYSYKKKFYTLPHQFDVSVFDVSDTSQVLKKSKKISISYHGALMFGRNAHNLLLAYQELLKEDNLYKEFTELVLRVKGDGIEKLKENFRANENIKILKTLDFSNSYNEQKHESDIYIILENGPLYCNILVGKAALLANFNKPILCISPVKSELRTIVVDKRCIANMHDVTNIKDKLKVLIDNRLSSKEDFKPFGDYFSNENFKVNLDKILND